MFGSLTVVNGSAVESRDPVELGVVVSLPPAIYCGGASASRNEGSSRERNVDSLNGKVAWVTGVYTLIFSSSTMRRTAGRSSMRSLKAV